MKNPEKVSFEVAAIPPGAALFHIGSPKTATSAIQYSASAKRSELGSKGVVYPEPPANAKSRHRHREGVRSLRAYGNHEKDSPIAWNALLEQRAADSEARLLMSDEWASTLPRRAIEYARESLGPGSQVVFSIRNYGDFLLSLWQEDLRSGKTDAQLDTWLQARNFSRGMLPDQGRIPIERQADRLQRWVDVFGADHVNVIVVAKKTPNLVYEFFASLLDLAPEDLAPRSGERRGAAGNRSLTAVEAELVQRVVSASKVADLPAGRRKRLLHEGAFRYVQQVRVPPATETRLSVPESLVEGIVACACDQLLLFQELGVRIIGDSAEFTRRPDTTFGPSVEDIPMDLAVGSLLGIARVARPRPRKRTRSEGVEPLRQTSHDHVSSGSLDISGTQQGPK